MQRILLRTRTVFGESSLQCRCLFLESGAVTTLQGQSGVSDSQSVSMTSYVKDLKNEGLKLTFTV